MASAAELAVFEDFGKMTRWNKVLVTVSEKIDGTNAQICITPDGKFQVGSRNRWIRPGKDTDNYGFAAWAFEHEEELRGLGIGRHFGEWWGYGIQRGYNCVEGERYFSLFQSYKWADAVAHRITCCKVVPILFHGQLGDLNTDALMAKLWSEGSAAKPGFKFPEGVILNVNGTNFKFPFDARHKWQIEGEAPMPPIGKTKEPLTDLDKRRRDLRAEWYKAYNCGVEGAFIELHEKYKIMLTESATAFAEKVEESGV